MQPERSGWPETTVKQKKKEKRRGIKICFSFLFLFKDEDQTNRGRVYNYVPSFRLPSNWSIHVGRMHFKYLYVCVCVRTSVCACRARTCVLSFMYLATVGVCVRQCLCIRTYAAWMWASWHVWFYTCFCFLDIYRRLNWSSFLFGLSVMFLVIPQKKNSKQRERERNRW